MNFTVRVWRQPSASAPGRMASYAVQQVSPEMSFLEMLDVLNEDLIGKNEAPIAFDHDCREGICGMCSLLINGVGRALFPDAHDSLAFGVLIIAISLTGWVQYARTVRGSTLVEKNKEYVQAARVIGRAPLAIMLRHVLPNAVGPVVVSFPFAVGGPS